MDSHANSRPHTMAPQIALIPEETPIKSISITAQFAMLICQSAYREISMPKPPALIIIDMQQGMQSATLSPRNNPIAEDMIARWRLRTCIPNTPKSCRATTCCAATR